MAGDSEHARLLRWFPGAISVECQGDGWVEAEYAEEPLSRPARCPVCSGRQLREAVAAFLPPRFRPAVPVPAAVQSWAQRGMQAEGLYLSGPVGTGKTHAAWMAVQAWCLQTGTWPGGAERPAVIFTRMTDLLDDFRPGDGSLRRVRDCQAAALLVIDDLGAEKPSEWTQERLYAVVDHRYAARLPLIVTGNLPPKKLADQTGPRVASRLAEMCRDVPMTGPDRRRGAA